MIIERFPENPLIGPHDVIPSEKGWEVLGAYNCGAFEYKDRIGLLVRVIERPQQTDPELVSAPLLDFSTGQPRMLVNKWRRNEVDVSDPRFVKTDIVYDAITSNLRLAWSDDGKTFEISGTPTLQATHQYERNGIHDPRVQFIDGRWTIIYSGGDPEWGVTISLVTTTDWETFQYEAVLYTPDNKDVALFPERIGGKYCCFNRPSGVYFGSKNMWLGFSDDLIHWGEFTPLALCRSGRWDSERIGCGPEPIKTEEGWLELYHGSDGGKYCLGAMLLDLQDPSKVIARSEEPLLAPEMDYEKYGFYHNVIFPHGLLKRTDDIYWLYYGGADRYTCGCQLSVSGVLSTLR